MTLGDIGKAFSYTPFTGFGLLTGNKPFGGAVGSSNQKTQQTQTTENKLPPWIEEYWRRLLDAGWGTYSGQAEYAPPSYSWPQFGGAGYQPPAPPGQGLLGPAAPVPSGGVMGGAGNLLDRVAGLLSQARQGGVQQAPIQPPEFIHPDDPRAYGQGTLSRRK